MTVVKAIDVALVRLPFAKPVRLGANAISFRDYVVLRCLLSDGSEGFAYGYDRGVPLFEVCAGAAKVYLGQPASDRNRLCQQALGAIPAPRATMTRGASLCDIALWDAWCVSQGQPLRTVLGGMRDRVPVMPIIGYGADAETAAAEAVELSAAGFTSIKCMIDGTDFAADRALMEAVTAALPRGVAFGIDAHWSWTSTAQAMPWCRLAERLGASFIEDPFSPTQIRAIAELSAKLDIPLAVGEDVIDLFGILDVVEVGGLLRVDASVIGGIVRTVQAISVAAAFSRPVIPHVFPTLHGQLACAFDTVQCVELITERVGADPICGYLVDPIIIENGFLVASDRPGAGIGLDWARLGPCVLRKERYAS